MKKKFQKFGAKNNQFGAENNQFLESSLYPDPNRTISLPSVTLSPLRYRVCMQTLTSTTQSAQGPIKAQKYTQNISKYYWKNFKNNFGLGITNLELGITNFV